MSDPQPKPLPVRSERKLYTPKPKQTQVIARHLNGESRRKIARVEGIDRETVDRILSQRELVSMLAEQQSRLLRLGAKALLVCEEALECDDLKLAVATATKILEGVGVMSKRGMLGTIDDARERYPHSGPILPEFSLRFERPAATPPVGAIIDVVDVSGSVGDSLSQSNSSQPKLMTRSDSDSVPIPEIAEGDGPCPS